MKMAAVALCLSAWSMQAAAENWITNLRDDVFVHQLSIPGTHDAGTGEGFESSFFDSFARTQDVTMREQWDSGIRAFDLRPTAVQTATGERYLKIYHGIVETKIRFDEALRLLCKQVKDNPGEFAIIIMRHETDGEKSNVGDLWEVLMDSCLNAEEFKGQLVQFRHNLKVGDMRGKVLVLSRDKYLNNKHLVGGYITNWSHSSDITSQKKGLINCTGIIKTSPSMCRTSTIAPMAGWQPNWRPWRPCSRKRPRPCPEPPALARGQSTMPQDIQDRPLPTAIARMPQARIGQPLIFFLHASPARPRA